LSNPSTKAVWGALVALAIWLPSPALAGPRQAAKLDKALQASSTSNESFEVIVRAKPGREGNVKSKVGRHTNDVHVHDVIRAVSATLTAHDIAELAHDPDVEGVSLNADVSPLAAGPLEDSKKAIDNSGWSSQSSSNFASTVVADLKQALGLDNRFTGANATVAIIDSGVATNVDFGSRIVAQYVFWKGRQYYTAPYDDYGHGTHVAGLIGSNGTSSNNKYAGIAPATGLLSLKVLDGKGTGKTSDVINAIEFAIANRARFGINVINLSLGHPIYESAATDPLVLAVEAAVRRGIVVVVSAGNHGTNATTGEVGYGGITSPGNAPSAITSRSAMDR